MRNTTDITQMISKLSQDKQRILNEISKTVITDDYLLKLCDMDELQLNRVMRMLHPELGECIERAKTQKSE